MDKRTVAVVFGTRPEAVKMIPVIKELQKIKSIRTVTISTGQHKEMLAQILTRFEINVDYEMDLMEPNQTLFKLSSKALLAFEKVLTDCSPSMLLVQGDTTTAFLGGLCSFYLKIPVGHVEAGLRTNNKYFPFPEEINRRLITACADFNFAPTDGNKDNLLKESIAPESIFVTGNTVIDTLLLTTNEDLSFPFPEINLDQKRLVLVTAHRRESFGQPMIEIFTALRSLAESYPDIEILYPVHLNPNVQEPANKILSNIKNIHLVKPLDYFDFVAVMKKAYLILTDSGGVQEEAPTLGIPVLVLRNETERPEAVEAGTVRLVGTSSENILKEAKRILDSTEERNKLSEARNPYGDGKASERIVYHIMKQFNLTDGLPEADPLEFKCF
jgi:UDP-N-acetylglucosamine 2-epimerase (non-hydrolysing)